MRKILETTKTQETNPEGYYVKADPDTGELVYSGSESDDQKNGTTQDEDDEDEEEDNVEESDVSDILSDPKLVQFLSEILKDIEDNSMADIKESFVGGDRQNVHQESPAGNETGAPSGNFRQMLAAELFGSAAFSHDLPVNDMLSGQNEVQLSQAEEGEGMLRPLREAVSEQIQKNLANLTADLFRQNLVTEAARVSELSEQINEELGKKLISVSFDIKLTEATASLLETLYQTVHLANLLKG